MNSVCEFPLPNGLPPAARSYWVIEGKFLAGAYPGSPDPLQHRQRLKQLWEAGLRTFISLMEETETNNSGQLFSTYDDILRELADDSDDQLACLRFPVRDLSIPSQDGMRSILDAIDQTLAANRPVYVHCFGGVGRTGTTVCCWLLRHGFAKQENVIQLLQQLRQADQKTKGRPAPENNEQVRFVKKWSEDETTRR